MTTNAPNRGRKPPVTAKIATVVQWVMAASCAAQTIYLVVLSRSREILAARDPAKAVRGLLTGAGALLVLAFLYGGSAWGMHKRSRWGWWSALVLNVGAVATFAYGMFEENPGHPDWEVLPFVMMFVAVMALLLWPGTRKAYQQVR